MGEENNNVYPVNVFDEKGKIVVSRCHLGVYEKHTKYEGFGAVIPTGEYGVGVFYPTKTDDKVQYFQDLLSDTTIAFCTDENGKVRNAMGGALDPHVDEARLNGTVNAVVDRLIGLVPMKQILPNIESVSKEELATVVKYFVSTQGIKDEIEQTLVSKLNEYGRKLREESNINDLFGKKAIDNDGMLRNVPIDDSHIQYNDIDTSLYQNIENNNIVRK